jgi:hypothetical protein
MSGCSESGVGCVQRTERRFRYIREAGRNERTRHWVSQTYRTPRSLSGACAPGAGQDWRRTASISRATWTFSLTTTPPPSSGIEMSTPNSLRLIVVVAEKPARVPP